MSDVEAFMAMESIQIIKPVAVFLGMYLIFPFKTDKSSYMCSFFSVYEHQ